jgi:hypothetical protein
MYFQSPERMNSKGWICLSGFRYLEWSHGPSVAIIVGVNPVWMWMLGS